MPGAQASPMEAPTCQAHKADGSRCRRRVAKDQDRCYQHASGLKARWHALTRSQSLYLVLALVALVGVPVAILAWVYPTFWARPTRTQNQPVNPANEQPQPAPPKAYVPQKEIGHPAVRPDLTLLGLVAVDVVVEEATKLVTFHSHGLSFIARVRGGKEIAFVGGIDLSGKVHLTPEEYIGYVPYPNGTPMENIDADYVKHKPYRVISWTGWPSDKRGAVKVEPGEEKFIRLTIVEAKPGSGLWFRPGPLSNYVGYDDGTRDPKWIDEFAEPRCFFYGAQGPSLAFGIREDFKNGTARIQVRVGPLTLAVPPSRLLGFRFVPKRDWDADAAEDIYFGKNYFSPSREPPAFHKETR
jgi:hypothetical protein